MSNKTFLGKVGMTPKGEWNSSTTYVRLDVVSYQGSSYIALTESTNSVPTDSNPNWMIGAKHGEFTEEQLEDFKAEVVAESKQEMDDYTEDKKDELDTHEQAKETQLNSYTEDKKGEIDTYVAGKTTDFNTNAENKTTAFNQNATSKTEAFNTNASSKTTDFNTNASDKTTAFNTNVETKTTNFNTNATEKTSTFNTNATEKIQDFDDHVIEKTQDFDEHADEILEDYLALKRSRKYTSGTGESVTLDNTAEGVMFRKLGISGNSKQDSYTGRNLLNRADETINDWLTFGLTSIAQAGESFYISVDITNLVGSITLRIEYTRNGTKDYLFGNTITSGTSGKLYIAQTFPDFDEGTNVILTVKNATTAFSSATLKNWYFTYSGNREFEKYVGGTASPNPSYPQAITSSGDSGSINNKVENKNLLNPEEFAQKVIATDYSENAHSTYDSETGELNIKMGKNNGVVFDNFKPNTRYTIFLNHHFSNTTTNATNLRLYYTDGTYQNLNSTNADGFIKITTTANKSVGSITHINADGSGTRIINLKESGIFEGVINESDYVPHAEQNFNLPCQQPMRAVGTTRDNFFKNTIDSEYYNAELDANAWYERHVIGSTELTAENVTSLVDAYNGSTFSTPFVSVNKTNLGMKNNYSSNVALINTYSKITDTSKIKSGTYSTGFSSGGIYIFDDRFTDLTTARQLLIGTIIVFAQATPTYLKCTDAQVEVLEAIVKAKSYYEQTNVYSTDPVSPVYDVEAYQDENLIYDSLEARVTLLE